MYTMDFCVQCDNVKEHADAKYEKPLAAFYQLRNNLPRVVTTPRYCRRKQSVCPSVRYIRVCPCLSLAWQ